MTESNFHSPHLKIKVLHLREDASPSTDSSLQRSKEEVTFSLSLSPSLSLSLSLCLSHSLTLTSYISLCINLFFMLCFYSTVLDFPHGVDGVLFRCREQPR